MSSLGAVRNGTRRVAPNGSPGAGTADVKWRATTLELLEQLTTADGVRSGDLGMVTASGNIYKAISADVVSSTWYPATGIFHLKDFGAVGDNVNDDTARVQAWFDHMAGFIAAFGGGAEGYVDPGDYRLTGQVDGISNLLVRGAGRLVSRFRADDAAGFHLLDFTNKSNVVLQSFGVEGDGQSLAGGAGIYFDNTGQSIVRDIDARTFEKGIVFANGSEDCRAEECWAVQTTTPFEASDSSNDSHFVLCRSVNALSEHVLLDGVSQCTVQQGSFQLSNTEVGVRFAATNADNIACGAYETRTEGPAGTVGYDFPASANSISYPTIQDPYWTGGVTPVTNWGNAVDPRVINRSRYWEPIIQQDPYLVNGGDLTAKLKWHNEGGAGASTEPECLDPRQHNPNTGVTGAPVIFRRNIAHIHCGANNQSTGGGPVYQALQGELGSLNVSGARVVMKMPFAGRVLRAGVIANQDHGSTDFEVWVNDALVVSDTQNLGAFRTNAADFVLSTNPADQHWAAGDYVAFALDTATTLTNPITVCDLIIEYDMRTSSL